MTKMIIKWKLVSNYLNEKLVFYIPDGFFIPVFRLLITYLAKGPHFFWVVIHFNEFKNLLNGHSTVTGVTFYLYVSNNNCIDIVNY